MKTPLKTILMKFLDCFLQLEIQESLYEDEFQNLKHLTNSLKGNPEYAYSFGLKDDNRSKNRYKDIVPYDFSRVVLPELTSIPCTDYINASYIKGASGAFAYIAAQGPLPNTVIDFWRMIWVCEVQVVVMACNEKEGGKTKCERYWAEEINRTKQFGEISVEFISELQMCPDFMVRSLLIKRNDAKPRKIWHFHYTTWPDHSVPDTVQPILQMVTMMRRCQASETAPILVHCSAGCGRTGTICAIDFVGALLRRGKLTENFCLHNIVSEMRKQRIAMVQTKEQYVLVYKAVAAMFEQQLRIIDSHPYENLDENGTPLILKGQEKMVQLYDNLSSLSNQEAKSSIECKPEDTADSSTAVEKDLKLGNSLNGCKYQNIIRDEENNIVSKSNFPSDESTTILTSSASIIKEPVVALAVADDSKLSICDTSSSNIPYEIVKNKNLNISVEGLKSGISSESIPFIDDDDTKSEVCVRPRCGRGYIQRPSYDCIPKFITPFDPFVQTAFNNPFKSASQIFAVDTPSSAVSSSSKTASMISTNTLPFDVSELDTGDVIYNKWNDENVMKSQTMPQEVKPINFSEEVSLVAEASPTKIANLLLYGSTNSKTTTQEECRVENSLDIKLLDKPMPRRSSLTRFGLKSLFEKSSRTKSEGKSTLFRYHSHHVSRAGSAPPSLNSMSTTNDNEKESLFELVSRKFRSSSVKSEHELRKETGGTTLQFSSLKKSAVSSFTHFKQNISNFSRTLNLNKYSHKQAPSLITPLDLNNSAVTSAKNNEKPEITPNNFSNSLWYDSSPPKGEKQKLSPVANPPDEAMESIQQKFVVNVLSSGHNKIVIGKPCTTNKPSSPKPKAYNTEKIIPKLLLFGTSNGSKSVKKDASTLWYYNEQGGTVNTENKSLKDYKSSFDFKSFKRDFEIPDVRSPAIDNTMNSLAAKETKKSVFYTELQNNPTKPFLPLKKKDTTFYNDQIPDKNNPLDFKTEKKCENADMPKSFWPTNSLSISQDIENLIAESAVDNKTTKSEIDIKTTKSEVSNKTTKSEGDNKTTKSEVDNKTTKSEVDNKTTKSAVDKTTKSSADTKTTKFAVDNKTVKSVVDNNTVLNSDINILHAENSNSVSQKSEHNYVCLKSEHNSVSQKGEHSSAVCEKSEHNNVYQKSEYSSALCEKSEHNNVSQKSERSSAICEESEHNSAVCQKTENSVNGPSTITEKSEQPEAFVPPELPKKTVIGRNRGLMLQTLNELSSPNINGNTIDMDAKLISPGQSCSHEKETVVIISEPTLNECRPRDCLYTNVNVVAKKNIEQIEKTLRNHPRGAIIDLTSRNSYSLEEELDTAIKKLPDPLQKHRAKFSLSQLANLKRAGYEVIWPTSDESGQFSLTSDIKLVQNKKTPDFADVKKEKERHKANSKASPKFPDKLKSGICYSPPLKRSTIANFPVLKSQSCARLDWLEKDDVVVENTGGSLKCDRSETLVNDAVVELSTLLDELTTRTLEDDLDLKQDTSSVLLSNHSSPKDAQCQQFKTELIPVQVNASSNDSPDMAVSENVTIFSEIAVAQGLETPTETTVARDLAIPPERAGKSTNSHAYETIFIPQVPPPRQKKDDDIVFHFPPPPSVPPPPQKYIEVESFDIVCKDGMLRVKSLTDSSVDQHTAHDPKNSSQTQTLITNENLTPPIPLPRRKQTNHEVNGYLRKSASYTTLVPQLPLNNKIGNLVGERCQTLPRLLVDESAYIFESTLSQSVSDFQSLENKTLHSSFHPFPPTTKKSNYETIFPQVKGPVTSQSSTNTYISNIPGNVQENVGSDSNTKSSVTSEADEVKGSIRSSIMKMNCEIMQKAELGKISSNNSKQQDEVFGVTTVTPDSKNKKPSYSSDDQNSIYGRIDKIQQHRQRLASANDCILKKTHHDPESSLGPQKQKKKSVIPSRKSQHAPPPPVSKPQAKENVGMMMDFGKFSEKVTRKIVPKQHEWTPTAHAIQRSSSAKDFTRNSGHSKIQSIPAYSIIQKQKLHAVLENISDSQNFATSSTLTSTNHPKVEKLSKNPSGYGLQYSQSDVSVHKKLREKFLHKGHFSTKNSNNMSAKPTLDNNNTDHTSNYEKLVANADTNCVNDAESHKTASKQNASAPVAPPRARRRSTIEIDFYKSNNSAGMPSSKLSQIKKTGPAATLETLPAVPVKTKEAFELPEAFSSNDMSCQEQSTIKSKAFGNSSLQKK